MEVVIKNTTDKKRKAIVFGFNYSLFESKKDEAEFLDISTDDGVEVTYDGVFVSTYSDFDTKNKLLKNEKIPFIVDEFEYTSNKGLGNGFMFYHQDANGDIEIIKRIIPALFTDIYQTTPNKVLIKKRIGIDHNSSFLFTLQPYQEIILNFKN